MAIGQDRNHDGRVDARDGVVHGASTTDRVVRTASDPNLTREVRKDAYERGRADERSRHKRNPLLTFLIALAAVLGLAVTALFIYNGGSFTEAGRDLDQVTGRAAQEAKEVGAEVADEAGEAMQDTGRRVEQTGESAQQPAQAPAERR